MALPLLPKATAVWLVENTTLTFAQIAKFCGLHELEVQAIADEEVAIGMHGIDPIVNKQLTKDELARCQEDPSTQVQLAPQDLQLPRAKSKGPLYTPIAKRADKPDAISWLLKTHPELADSQICRLIGTTKPTIGAIRDHTHWNTQNLRPRGPIELGLCKPDELAAALATAARRAKPSETQAALSKPDQSSAAAAAPKPA